MRAFPGHYALNESAYAASPESIDAASVRPLS